MKLKNISKGEKRLLDRGKIKIVKPGKVIEVEKPQYDKRSFKKYSRKVRRKKSSTRIPRKKIKSGGKLNG